MVGVMDDSLQHATWQHGIMVHVGAKMPPLICSAATRCDIVNPCGLRGAAAVLALLVRRASRDSCDPLGSSHVRSPLRAADAVCPASSCLAVLLTAEHGGERQRHRVSRARSNASSPRALPSHSAIKLIGKLQAPRRAKVKRPFRTRRKSWSLRLRFSRLLSSPTFGPTCKAPLG